ncbi:MAG: hypothetical protein AAFV95_12650 [Bacteroidota bacterium]
MGRTGIGSGPKRSSESDEGWDAALRKEVTDLLFPDDGDQILSFVQQLERGDVR